MLSKPLFWFAVVAALSPVVALLIVTGRPTRHDVAYFALWFVLGLLGGWDKKR